MQAVRALARVVTGPALARSAEPLEQLALRSSASRASARPFSSGTEAGKGATVEAGAEAAAEGAPAEASTSREGGKGEGGEESSAEAPRTQEELVADVAQARQELAEVQKQHDELKERLLRTLADMENLRERTARQLSTHKRHATEGLIKSFLEVADNLERASEAVPKEALEGDDGAEPAIPAERALQLLRGLREGVLLTDRVLVQILGKQGVSRYDPSGEQFDPNFHSALFEVPSSAAGVPDGQVAVVVKKGYRYDDRPLRAAEVGVAKGE